MLPVGVGGTLQVDFCKVDTLADYTWYKAFVNQHVGPSRYRVDTTGWMDRDSAKFVQQLLWGTPFNSETLLNVRCTTALHGCMVRDNRLSLFIFSQKATQTQ